MLRRILVIAALVLLVSPIWADTAAQAVPTKSLEKIQQTLGRVTDLLWEKSDGFFHVGDYERSVATLRLITDLDPTDLQAYSVGAWLIDSRERPSEAEAFLKLGLSRNPNHYEMYSELGDFYFNKQNYAAAVGYFESALKFKDCPIVLWHMLAHAYERSGSLQKSIETWEHALTLEPGDGTVLVNLKRVKDEMAAQGSK